MKTMITTSVRLLGSGYECQKNNIKIMSKAIKRTISILLISVISISCTKEEIVNRETVITPLQSAGTSSGANWTNYSAYSRVEADIVVSGLQGRINELELKLNAEVSGLDYLDFYLISPSNQILPLMGYMTQTTPGLITMDVKLTDKGPLYIDDWTESTSMTGSFYPSGESGYGFGLANQMLYDFKGFNDQNPNGQWTLYVREKFSGSAYARILSAELLISTKY